MIYFVFHVSASILQVFHSNYPYNHQSPIINIVYKMKATFPNSFLLLKKVIQIILSKKQLHPFSLFSNSLPQFFKPKTRKKKKKKRAPFIQRRWRLHPSNASFCVIEASIDMHTHTHTHTHMCTLDKHHHSRRVIPPLSVETCNLSERCVNGWHFRFC